MLQFLIKKYWGLLGVELAYTKKDSNEKTIL